MQFGSWLVWGCVSGLDRFLSADLLTSKLEEPAALSLSGLLSSRMKQWQSAKRQALGPLGLVLDCNFRGIGWWAGWTSTQAPWR